MTAPGMRRVGGLALGPLLGLTLTLALAACGPAPDPLAPPEIHYGEDACDACQMIISEPRFAAASIVDAGAGPEPRRFDDIGDLVDYHRDRPELTVLAWHVHDYDSEAWIDASRARFVRAKGIRSPMGHGLAAFADAARAEAFAAEMDGELLGFDDLLPAAAVDAAPPGG